MTVTNYEELKAAFELVEKEKDKNLKGYAFDSLVFRYQLASKEQAILDTEKIAYKKNISKIETRRIAEDRAERDIMRFIQILDEIIGEHN